MEHQIQVFVCIKMALAILLVSVWLPCLFFSFESQMFLSLKIVWYCFAQEGQLYFPSTVMEWSGLKCMDLLANLESILLE